MEILVDANGKRNRDFRPYIDQEEQKRNVLIYDPNGYNLNTGLYTKVSPASCCEEWVPYFCDWRRRKCNPPPFYAIDQWGRTIPYEGYQQVRMVSSRKRC